MHSVRTLCGLAILATAFGCSKKTDQSSQAAKTPSVAEAPTEFTAEQARQGAAGQAEVAREGQYQMAQGATRSDVNTHDLVIATVHCVLAPSLSDASSHGHGAGTSSSDTAPTERCEYVARAVNLDPSTIASGDPATIATVRKVVERRLATDSASPEATNHALALFDKGVAAAKEARVAENAQSTGGDQFRAHSALGDLYKFGQSQGTSPIGTEAQALAWIIATDRFLDVESLPADQKALAAEPLFTAILMVPPPAAQAGREAPAWKNYLSTAARSAGPATGQASGKGATTSPNDEKGKLDEIITISEERMEALGDRLPNTSVIRVEIDRALANLKDFDTRQPQQKATKKKQPEKTNNPKP